MAYTKSKAGIGLKTTLSIGDGAGTEMFILVGELKTLAQSGRSVATEDVTNFDSAAREFIPTLLDSGTWALTGSRIGNDVGQVAMEAAFAGLVNHNFKIQLPKQGSQTTTGDLFTFNALVQDLNYSIGFDKATTFSATLKVSGLVALTAGT